MKKIILIILISLLISILAAAEPVAYLIKTKGSVQIYRDNKSIKLKSGEMLYNNDEIITNAKSYAAFRYADGSGIVKLFPNSVMKLNVSKLDAKLHKNSQIELGSIFSKISAKIKGTYKTETPNTVASVKGTGYITRYLSDKRTIVIVTEGEVLVMNKISGKSVLVKQGETAISDDSGEISVRPTEPGDIEETEQNEIDTAEISVQKSIRVQITDENGNIKYLDITY